MTPAAAQGGPAVRGEVSATVASGHARLVFTLTEDVEASVRVANGIVVISFKRPVELNVDRLPVGAAGYIGAARQDPDGTAVRLALTRKVTVNSMAAGERLFIDLLPEGWTGLPPGLPQSVVDELARRAREAEARNRRTAAEAQRPRPPIRVRVGRHPTFVRYVFELPEPIGIETRQDAEGLHLAFDRILQFDLADARSELPSSLGAIEVKPEREGVAIRFVANGAPDLTTFREENTFVVDVSTGRQQGPNGGAAKDLPEEPETKRATRQAAVQQSSIERDGIVPNPRELADRSDRKSSLGAVPFPPVRPAVGAMREHRVPNDQSARLGSFLDQVIVSEMPALARSTELGGALDKRVEVPEAGEVVREQPARSAQVARSLKPDHAEQREPERAREDGVHSVKFGSLEVERSRELTKLRLSFDAPVPAAIFRRFDTLWLVFDGGAPIEIPSHIAEAAGFASATVAQEDGSQIVRLQLARPRLVSAVAEGANWTVLISDAPLDNKPGLSVVRAIAEPERASITVPFEGAATGRLHRITDAEIGDILHVVTGRAPVRGLNKQFDLVELRVLASIHGVVLQPLADDLRIDLAPDKVVVGRPGGLTLSADGAVAPLPAVRVVSGNTFDVQLWGYNKQAIYSERQAELLNAAAKADGALRGASRVDLARFYAARELYPEARAVLDVAMREDRTLKDDPSIAMLAAALNILTGRARPAIEELGTPALLNQPHAGLWRAWALSKLGKWQDANAAFKSAHTALGLLPLELQRAGLVEAVRAAIEARDFADAARSISEFDTIGVPPELRASLEVMSGRIAEGLGRFGDALTAYRNGAESPDRSAAAQARLREIALRHQLQDLKNSDAIGELESLTATWRGDETEAQALHMLAKLYTEGGRYREAFSVVRTATKVHPGSELTRVIQEDAASTFHDLFLSSKGDALTPVEALSLFYDFRQLTPIGRRGDEMIRRLAERLVAVDLLDQAAELLQHQVDHRLQGAARAQVGVRLALIYLMNRRADRALTVLRATRQPDLSNELRSQRLLVEARALSDSGRHDVALEVVANLKGMEVDQLRADILWAAKRWLESGEQMERMQGERWRDFAPLGDTERTAILRAAIAYALADDALALARLREKYGAKMAEGPDRAAFDAITTPTTNGRMQLGDLAQLASAVDTMQGFLRDMRNRYPQRAGAEPDGTLSPKAGTGRGSGPG